MKKAKFNVGDTVYFRDSYPSHVSPDLPANAGKSAKVLEVRFALEYAYKLEGIEGSEWWGEACFKGAKPLKAKNER